MKKFFNFNNEADLTEVDVNEETGVVTFSLGGQSQAFESMQEFAEFYAVARNVVPENLKNWTLIEDGTQVAFVLRAGTAGLNEQEIAGIARGLKAAGLGPDEIGRAVMAAQKEAEHVEIQETRAASNAALTAQIDAAINELSEGDKEILAYKAIVDNEQRASIILAEKSRLEREMDEDYFGEYDEEYTEEDMIDLAIASVISKEVAELENTYPGIPANIAIMIQLGDLSEQPADREAFNRLKVVNGIAGRASMAAHVIDSEDLTVTDVQTSDEEFVTNEEDGIIVVKDHKVYLVI